MAQQPDLAAILAALGMARNSHEASVELTISKVKGELLYKIRPLLNHPHRRSTRLQRRLQTH